MPGPWLSVPNFGFDTNVRDVCCAAGAGVGNGSDFDYNNSLAGPSKLVGTSVVVPGNGNGLCVTGISGSTDTQEGVLPAVRLVVLALPGDPSALVGVIQSLSFAVGGFLTGLQVPGTLGQGGVLLPDITTGQLSSVAAFTGQAAGFITAGFEVFVPSGLRVLFDAIDPIDSSNGMSRQFSFVGRGGLMVPPNVSVAGLFIAMASTDGSGFSGATTYSFRTAGGSLQGFALTAADVAAASNGGFTPARFGNVEVPGTL